MPNENCCLKGSVSVNGQHLLTLDNFQCDSLKLVGIFC